MIELDAEGYIVKSDPNDLGVRMRPAPAGWVHRGPEDAYDPDARGDYTGRQLPRSGWRGRYNVFGEFVPSPGEGVGAVADTERLSTDDQLDVVDLVLVRESLRRRSVLRGHGGGKNLVSVPDGGHRSGRKALRDALRPWTLATVDEDDDHVA